MFGGVECDDSKRVTVLARHQIADDGFEIGFANIGFCECRAEVSVIVDDEIKILIVAVRHNRRNEAPAHKRLQTQRLPREHETEASEPQSITADRLCDDIGRALRGTGAHTMSASVIAATRSMSELGCNRTSGGYVRIDDINLRIVP
jgi:hypothetical protein